MKIGIIKEGKIPADRRTPLLPAQCKLLQETYPDLQILVQSSTIRCIEDEAYTKEGILVKEDISECDIFLGVKEVPVDHLISNKTYLFFSHTIKQQPHNRHLLKIILDKNITLIDYECLTDLQGNRVIGFGRFAGIVGAYNGIRAYGQRYKLFQLKPAYQCTDLQELKRELKKVKLPKLKLAVTGSGRVSKGVTEVLREITIKKVSPKDFLTKIHQEPVYTVLQSKDYYQPTQNIEFEAFYSTPEKFQTNFIPFTKVTDVLIAAHFWNPKAPVLFHKQDISQSNFKIKIIADITCDVEGSIPTTLQTTTIENPFYDYNPTTQKIEEAFTNLSNITVMAVDNLPCEIPVDASKSFGKQLIQSIFPALLQQDTTNLLTRATITKSGELTSNFNYLEGFVNS